MDKVEYDGAYPNLCSGTLILTIDGTRWEFPSYCLSSGGSVGFDSEWNEYVEEGDWSIREWPEGFPQGLRDRAEQMVNANISKGCCGGCL